MAATETTQILVRGIDRSTLNILKEAAKRNGRSLEAEVRASLTEAAAHHLASTAARDRAIAEARRIKRELAGQMTSDSVDLIREDRDR